MAENHILHIDMDAFFAAVEQLDHPEWRGKPVVVGAAPNQRGVVSTASYEARKYGIHSAMSSREAYARCPHAIFVSGNHARYEEVSAQVMAIMESISPFLEQVSIDEAFLELAGVRGVAENPVAAGEEVRRRIREQTGLTASVGIASNMFLAKIASDVKKPDGLTVVPEDPREIAAFLAPMPVGRLWGVGVKTGEILARCGLYRVADLQRTPESTLIRLLGNAAGSHLHQLAFGIDHRKVQVEAAPEQSVSQEHTFGEDCSTLEIVRSTLMELAEKVGSRLREGGIAAGCASIKLRYGDFRTITRQIQLRPHSNSDRALRRAADELLAITGLPENPVPVRLIGFGTSGLAADVGGRSAPRQGLLFQEDIQAEEDQRKAEENDRAVDKAVDAIRRKFGSGVIRRMG